MPDLSCCVIIIAIDRVVLKLHLFRKWRSLYSELFTIIIGCLGRFKFCTKINFMQHFIFIIECCVVNFTATFHGLVWIMQKRSLHFHLCDKFLRRNLDLMRLSAMWQGIAPLKGFAVVIKMAFTGYQNQLKPIFWLRHKLNINSLTLWVASVPEKSKYFISGTLCTSDG